MGQILPKGLAVLSVTGDSAPKRKPAGCRGRPVPASSVPGIVPRASDARRPSLDRLQARRAGRRRRTSFDSKPPKHDRCLQTWQTCLCSDFFFTAKAIFGAKQPSVDFVDFVVCQCPTSGLPYYPECQAVPVSSSDIPSSHKAGSRPQGRFSSTRPVLVHKAGSRPQGRFSSTRPVLGQNRARRFSWGIMEGTAWPLMSGFAGP